MSGHTASIMNLMNPEHGMVHFELQLHHKLSSLEYIRQFYFSLELVWGAVV